MPEIASPFTIPAFSLSNSAGGNGVTKWQWQASICLKCEISLQKDFPEWIKIDIVQKH